MRKMVALLTDFGLKDNFVGVMKAVVATINPEIKIIDISHQVKNHNIKEAAFLLACSCSYFPKGTVFLAVVDPGVGSPRRAVAIKTTHYCFVGPDNGILSVAAKKDGVKKIVMLENKRYFLKNISSTFHGRDIFAPVAAYLATRVPIVRFGRSIEAIEAINFPIARVKGDTLQTEIIYVDTFGNLVTNVTKEQIRNFCNGRDFVALLNRKKISKIYSSYAHATDKEPFFIEGSFSTLEIAIKNRSAADYFSYKNYGKITVRCLSAK